MILLKRSWSSFFPSSSVHLAPSKSLISFSARSSFSCALPTDVSPFVLSLPPSLLPYLSLASGREGDERLRRREVDAGGGKERAPTLPQRTGCTSRTQDQAALSLSRSLFLFPTLSFFVSLPLSRCLSVSLSLSFSISLSRSRSLTVSLSLSVFLCLSLFLSLCFFSLSPSLSLSLSPVLHTHIHTKEACRQGAEALMHTHTQPHSTDSVLAAVLLMLPRLLRESISRLQQLWCKQEKETDVERKLD